MVGVVARKTVLGGVSSSWASSPL